MGKKRKRPPRIRHAPGSRVLVATLGDALEVVPGLRLVYLFGSRARDEGRAGSDVDLAVLFDGDPDFDDVTRVAKAVRPVADGAEVEVIPLAWARPTVRFRVIREGVLCWSRSTDDENEFETAAHREYLDTRHLRAIRREHYERWLEEEAGPWS